MPPEDVRVRPLSGEPPLALEVRSGDIEIVVEVSNMREHKFGRVLEKVVSSDYDEKSIAENLSQCMGIEIREGLSYDSDK